VHHVDSSGVETGMRGEDRHSEGLFSYIDLEARVPSGPSVAPDPRVDGRRAGGVVAGLKLYARDGRASIPPERLLRALLLQAFYTVRSEGN
jgi:hypothetical protein